VNIIGGIVLFLKIEFIVVTFLKFFFLENEDTPPPANPPEIVLINPLTGLPKLRSQLLHL